VHRLTGVPDVLEVVSAAENVSGCNDSIRYYAMIGGVIYSGVKLFKSRPNNCCTYSYLSLFYSVAVCKCR
jgi:hypothetical protein